MTILVIDNRNGRNEEFIPIFKKLATMGHGKLEENFYICDSKLQLMSNDRNEFAFTIINNASLQKGFMYTMFQIK